MVEQRGREDVIPASAAKVGDKVLGLCVGICNPRKSAVGRVVTSILAGVIRAENLVPAAYVLIDADGVGRIVDGRGGLKRVVPTQRGTGGQRIQCQQFL